MKKVLITGINGFSGRYLAEYLLRQKVAVYGMDIAGTKAPLLPPNRYYRINLLNRRAVQTVIKKIRPDYIFHLAALLRGHRLEEFLQVNVLGTGNILDAALVVKAKVLISGSAAEYGWVSRADLPIDENTPPRPVDNYGVSKLVQTMLGYQYFLRQGLPVYLARVFNMTGPGEPERMVCSTLARQIRRIKERKAKPVIYVGNLTPRRDFIDVRDVVRAYWSLINHGRPGVIYNICSGQAHSIKEVLAVMLKLSRLSKVSVKSAPRRTRMVDVPVQVGNNRRLRQDTGWRPQISFRQTMRDILQCAELTQ